MSSSHSGTLRPLSSPASMAARTCCCAPSALARASFSATAALRSAAAALRSATLASSASVSCLSGTTTSSLLASALPAASAIFWPVDLPAGLPASTSIGSAAAAAGAGAASAAGFSSSAAGLAAAGFFFGAAPPAAASAAAAASFFFFSASVSLGLGAPPAPPAPPFSDGGSTPADGWNTPIFAFCFPICVSFALRSLSCARFAAFFASSAATAAAPASPLAASAAFAAAFAAAFSCMSFASRSARCKAVSPSWFP
mmetsp:Transcript_6861/g.17103  ORF Transcript_6861/g.17103 Transcript_6861/m.17103 type:complete len:256 (-) Transcript_6861:95-862(-)